MELRQEIDVRLTMGVNPRMVAAAHILELSSMELQQAITTELADNPALELLERPTCSACGGLLQGSVCPTCLAQQKGPPTGADGADGGSDDYVPEPSLAMPTNDDFDPLTQIGAQMTLPEHLLNELRACLHSSDLPIAEYLVGSLDDNGYLHCSVGEVTEALGVSTARVETVLEALQSLEPAGIGARDLRECLLIQLSRRAEDRDKCPPLARQVVENHLHELGGRKYAQIASSLDTFRDAVVEVADFIRTQLHPFPARGYSAREIDGSDHRSAYVLPDVIVNRRQAPNGFGDGFEVDVVESARFRLRVAPFYLRLAAEIRNEPGRFSDEEKQHIRQYVSRGKLFIGNINQRRQTIQKITEFVVDVQKEFLRQGIRHLKPLTRKLVAAELGMHESTISRATASKYVMLPNRKVIPFRDFFTPWLPVMDVIKDLIAREERPRADQNLADELAARGTPIARRTVAKYRVRLNILPSALRVPGRPRTVEELRWGTSVPLR